MAVAPFIVWHSEVKLTPMVTPSGHNWNKDENNLVGGLLFDRDMSSLFPYINAVVDRAVYLAQPPFIRFRHGEAICALHPFYVAAFSFADRPEAETYFADLVAFLNDIHARRHALRPSHKTFNPVSVLEIIKLLPKTNCRQCGFATCMAFAGAVRTGRALPRQCPELAAPMTEQVVYPVYDDQGHVIDTVALEVDSGKALAQLSRQRETIASLEKRLAELQQQAAPRTVDYEPPFGLHLSPRELEVLRLVAHGATNTEISELLGISPHTVKSHVISIFNKLGVNDRTQAGVWAALNGIL